MKQVFVRVELHYKLGGGHRGMIPDIEMEGLFKVADLN